MSGTCPSGWPGPGTPMSRRLLFDIVDMSLRNGPPPAPARPKGSCLRWSAATSLSSGGEPFPLDMGFIRRLRGSEATPSVSASVTHRRRRIGSRSPPESQLRLAWGRSLGFDQPRRRIRSGRSPRLRVSAVNRSVTAVSAGHGVDRSLSRGTAFSALEKGAAHADRVTLFRRRDTSSGVRRLLAAIEATTMRGVHPAEFSAGHGVHRSFSGRASSNPKKGSLRYPNSPR